MEPQVIIHRLLKDGIREPLGTSPLNSLRIEEVMNLESHFRKTLWADKELIAKGISDFDALDAFIQACAERKEAVTLSDQSRISLAVLARIYLYLHERRGPLPESLRQVVSSSGIIVIEFREDDKNSKKALADLAEYRKWERLSESCMLNAAYSCSDPYVLITAGRYYLEIATSDVAAAIGYFIGACKNDQKHIGVCNMLLREFVKKRESHYPLGSLKPYLDHWEEYKRKTLG